MKQFAKEFIYHLAKCYMYLTGVMLFLWIIVTGDIDIKFELGIMDYIFAAWAITYSTVKAFDKL